MNLLLLEDEMLIALDLEMTLRELGAETVHVANSVDHAMAVLASHDIDGAIVDYHLGIENSGPVLQDLERRNIPFAVLSGYPDSSYLGDGRHDWPMLSKPVSIQPLREALDRMRAR